MTQILKGEYNKEQTIRNKFTLISFMCSIFVIYIHTYNLETYGITENMDGLPKIVYCIETYWPYVVTIAVPMFFFISGILFFRTFEVSKLFDKWKKRFFTIFLPYIIWCTLYYLYYVICTNTPAIRTIMNGSEVVKLSFGEWVRWLWVNEYFTLWFLQNLIIYIAVTPLIWLLLKNHLSKLPTGLAALAVILIGMKHLRFSIPYTYGIEFYLAGSYIGLNCREWLKYKNKFITLISCIYIIFNLVTVFKYWNFIAKILFFIAIWYACDLFTSENTKYPWWMSITFFTYVAHDVFLEAFEKIVWKVFGNHAIFALLDYIFMPLAVEALLIGIAYIMRRKLPVIWKIITGDRGKSALSS
jgi:fucose 4-O-acetylase-like acetyltransferase